MKYSRFEDLPVWQAAVDLGNRIFLMVEADAFRGRGDLRNQLQRASLSISNNIAEGFEKGTTQELISFLYNARGSAGEVRSMLGFMERLPFFENLKSEISNFKLLAENVSRQLRAWADSLQNSGIKGTRYLNDSVRAEFDRQARTETFLRRLSEVRKQAGDGNRGSSTDGGDPDG
jgi:four helix bundle protein